MRARGKFLLARAISVHYYQCVVAFTCIATEKTETLPIGRKANPAYIFPQLLRRAAKYRNLIEHCWAASFGAKIVNVVSIGRKSLLSESNTRPLRGNHLHVAGRRHMPDPQT